MQYYTKEEHREHQLEWINKRRKEAVEYLGGKCVDCDKTEDLHFHHTKNKYFNIGSMWSWARDALYREIDKCVLLCKLCHKNIHRSKAEHGTYARYKTGCKCKECNLANRDYTRKIRSKFSK